MIHGHANNTMSLKMTIAIDSEVTVITRNNDLDDFDNDFAEINLINFDKFVNVDFHEDDDDEDDDNDDDDDDDDDDDEDGPFFLPAGHPSRHGGRGVHGDLFSTTPLPVIDNFGSYSSKFPWFRGQRS